MDNQQNQFEKKIDRLNDLVATAILILVFFQIIGDQTHGVIIIIGSLICWFIPAFLRAYSNRELEKAKKKEKEEN